MGTDPDRDAARASPEYALAELDRLEGRLRAIGVAIPQPPKEEAVDAAEADFDHPELVSKQGAGRTRGARKKNKKDTHSGKRETMKPEPPASAPRSPRSPRSPDAVVEDPPLRDPFSGPARSDAERAVCAEVCTLAQAICDLEAQICELGSRHPQDPRYQRACVRAQGDCAAASAACRVCSG